MKPRIILLARRLDAGGTQRQIASLASSLKRCGNDVHVVLMYPGGQFFEELLDKNVPVHVPGKKGRWDVLGFLFRLALCIRRLQPDILYSFLDLPNLLGAGARYLVRRCRLVWGVRAAFVDPRRYGLLMRAISLLEARLSYLPDLIIANSHAGVRWAVGRGFPEDRLRVVENGIDLDYYTPDASFRLKTRQQWMIHESERLIGLVARLDPMKGHRVFLKACARLSSRFENLKFVCVGTGDSALKRELDHFASLLGIADHLMWIDEAADMPSIYNGLDLLCSASVFGEGFPNVIAEAMACGLPVVVTDVGDSARIVGDLGAVVAPGDCKALASAIEVSLCRTTAQLDRSALLRGRISRNYSEERMRSQTLQLLEELLDARSSRHH